MWQKSQILLVFIKYNAFTSGNLFLFFSPLSKFYPHQNSALLKFFSTKILLHQNSAHQNSGVGENEMLQGKYD